MKVLAVILVAMGLVLAIAPQFTNCEAKGGSMPGTTMTTASGGSAMGGSSTMAAAAAPVPKMKCLWTARASLAVGVPLAVMGALLFFSRRKETRRALAVLGALAGVFAILLPTVLIGHCANSDAVCSTTMTPIMISAGAVALAVSLIVLVANEWRTDMSAGAEAAA